MSARRTLDPATNRCIFHARHSPRPWVLHAHHVIHESWTKAAGLPPSKTVPLCPTGHDNVHIATRLLLQGHTLANRMSPAMSKLVMEAVNWWQNRPIELPRTLLESAA